MELTKDIKEKLEKLDKKYASIGQDLPAYLDGLLYANPLHYWDYTYVDTLLSLQHPKTDFPDEQIFIIYHQITELYFKLALLELEQISNNGKKMSDDGRDMGWNDSLSPDFFVERLKRINSYFEVLTSSFGIMVNGMEKEQFLKFRMSLLPSSGFQSAQYRQIEIASTELINLIDFRFRKTIDRNTPYEHAWDNMYWQAAGVDHSTGKKNKLMVNFEAKYKIPLIEWMKEYNEINLWTKFKQLPESDQKNIKVN